MYRNYFLTTAIILLTSPFLAHSQIYPKVGEKIRDFQFTDLVNSEKQKISNQDLNGKWFILDFWTRYCGGCIASFPKINQISKDFVDSVTVIMVGAYDNAGNSFTEEQRTIKKLFSNHQQKYGLEFINAFDSTAIRDFDISAVPLILIVNPQGEIVAKTYKIDSLSLSTILSGKDVNLPYSYSKQEKDPLRLHDFSQPLLANLERSDRNEAESYMTRVLFTKWNKSLPINFFYGFGKRSKGKRPTSAEIIGMEPSQFLRLGWFGKVYWDYSDPIYNQLSIDPIVESKNARTIELFEHNDNGNRFCFSIDQPGLPPDGKLEQQYLRFQLENFFNISVSIEDRMIKGYRLILTDRSRLEKFKSKGGSGSYELLGANDGIRVTNTSIDQFLHSDLVKSITNIKPFALVLNESHVDFNIDITFHANLDDITAVRKNLRKIGLDIIRDQISMKALVVRDKN